MNVDKSLSDLEKILSEHKSLKDYIDETGEIFVSASTLFAILIAPSPAAAIGAFGTGTGILSFKFSKLCEWLPEKLNYRNKGKELTVVERYEKAALVNMMSFHIAIRCAIKETMFGHIENYQISLKDEDTEAQQHRALELSEGGKRLDKKIRNLTLNFGHNIDHCITTYIRNLCEQFVEEILHRTKTFTELYPQTESPEEELSDLPTIEETLQKIEEATIIYYNAYLIHLSNEFPEFALWVDLHQKDNILKKQKQILKELSKKEKHLIEIQNQFLDSIKDTLKNIELLQSYSFEKDYGFEKLISNQHFNSRKLDDLKSLYKEEKLAHIEAHHNHIKGKLEERLIDNEDIEGIVYPKIKDIFVYQSFKAFSYKRQEHQKQFLLDSFWNSPTTKKGENVGKFILNELYTPNNSFNPIILLGNPGAGKSMLSQVLAARLCESNDFVPFFIRLRDVSLVDTILKNHINEGIKNTIAGNPNVDWTMWAKEFKDRIPVIILDGFDELLRASQAEINNYIVKIKGLLTNAYQNYGISARIILTSRLTVMQDVDIPDNTTIIRLEAFDPKRQKQWIEQWNSHQNKQEFKDFQLPNKPSIIELGKEPLLLFMLAVYDFENNELQTAAMEQDFNQSKLYHKLFDKFTERQLKKDPQYEKASKLKQKKLSKKFRLRLGVISVLMFLNDVTHKETQKLQEELNAFGLGGKDTESNLIFKGFFFIHKDKSTAMTGGHLYTFEFIHRSFGEFLTADFLLRIILERFECDDEIEKLSKNHTLRFCWGFNWLNKHYNTTRFLFEHIDVLIGETMQKKPILKLIKDELKGIFGTNIELFPVSDLNLIKNKPVIEHLGIYSQNLVLLWVALNKQESPFPFSLYTIEDTVEESLQEKIKFEYQDRTDNNENKKIWKKICKLWEISGGNKHSVGKLKEWVATQETQENIFLSFNNGESKFNFSDSAQIACNDYELLLSYSDNPTTLNDVMEIIKRKPEFSPTATKVINNKFDVFFAQDEDSLLKVSTQLSRDALTPLSEKVRLLENLHLHYSSVNLYQHFRHITQYLHTNEVRSIILETTGNLPYWFLYGDNTYDTILDVLLPGEIEALGTEKYINLTNNYLKKYHIGLNSNSLKKSIQLQFSKIAKKGSDAQMIRYLLFIQKYINQELSLPSSFIMSLIDDCFIKVKKFHPFHSGLIYQYIKTIILYKINPKYKTNQYSSLLKKFLAFFFYKEKTLFLNLLKENNIPFFIDIFELLIISIKNRNIKLEEDTESIIEICESFIEMIDKKATTYYEPYHMFKYIDFLSILASSKSKGNEYSSILYRMILLTWDKYLGKRTNITLFEYIKQLNIISKFKDIFQYHFLNKVFEDFYEYTHEFKYLNSKQLVIILILLHRLKGVDGFRSLEQIQQVEHLLEHTHPKLNLDYISAFEDEFLDEFNNNFYYETDYTNNFPYMLLRGSILHGDDEEF